MDRVGDDIGGVSGHEGACRESLRRQPLLLSNALLNDEYGRATGPHRHVFSGRRKHIRMNLFDLQRDHVTALREIHGGIDVVEGRRNGARCDRAGGAGRIRIEHMHVVPHRARRKCGHASELSASEKADGGARQDRAATHGAMALGAASIRARASTALASRRATSAA